MATSDGEREEHRAWTHDSLELTFAYEVLVLIPTCIGDFTNFFQDISFDNET